MFFTPPLALLLSTVALFSDASRIYGIVGMIISGLTCGLYFLPLLIS